MNQNSSLLLIAICALFLALVIHPKKVKGTNAASHMNLQFGAKP